MSDGVKLTECCAENRLPTSPVGETIGEAKVINGFDVQLVGYLSGLAGEAQHPGTCRPARRTAAPALSVPHLFHQFQQISVTGNMVVDHRIRTDGAEMLSCALDLGVFDFAQLQSR